MAGHWIVEHLKIQTLTTALFANGNMQVPVYVSIKASLNDELYRLSQDDLCLIQLVDFYNAENRLSGSWSYSTVENEFSHRLDGPAPTGSVEISPDSQSICFWVSTTRVEDRTIAAGITQPDDSYITTNGGNFYSQVTLSGVSPVVYTTAQNIQISREKTERGTWGNKTFFVEMGRGKLLYLISHCYAVYKGRDVRL
ncbi:uncharacterized protein TrAtP1_007312 [Trichoderma atroviride]|uniref:uncharacterized protein n=1 Tax=Hypocrea atroviridis TaxID=63577 RepID=UPI003328B3B5|nr:hypothetical protein TrAtP1_007312 [Trichoderma atroviride]